MPGFRLTIFSSYVLKNKIKTEYWMKMWILNYILAMYNQTSRRCLDMSIFVIFKTDDVQIIFNV